jgi:hypothetical protein
MSRRYTYQLNASSASQEVVVEADSEDEAEMKMADMDYVEEGPVVWETFDPDEQILTHIDGKSVYE